MRSGINRLEPASGTSARLTNGAISNASSAKIDHVAMQEHGNAHADRAAVDGGNDRRARLGERGQQRIRILGLGRRRGIADRRKIGQIIARSEHVAVGLDQYAADIRVAVGIGDLRGQRLVHGARQRIFLVGPIERERQEAYLPFPPQRAVSQEFSFV